MRLLFLFGPPASGKLTVAREIAAQTGLAVFHNHLVVDAIAAVFPFGSPAFVRLRERFWLAAFAEAVTEGRSLIFTFAPEPTVAPDFPERAAKTVADLGGAIDFVRLTVSAGEQEKRLVAPDRAEHGKLRSIELLRQLRDDFAACDAAMPEPRLTIDTARLDPAQAAACVVERLGLDQRESDAPAAGPSRVRR